MEKRFRDYLRHLDKLDFDVISEEEIWEEREGLELKLTEIHQEMMRLLIPMMVLIVCTCIFLAAGFGNFFIGNFTCAAVMALAAVYIGLKYRTLVKVVKQLCIYIDKLTVK
ncbi:MAG: hypothetical protein II936_05990 [Oscillospiraceae bacterium]|nr:hypothetical protein [Oscillospiraceae bacterium]